MVNPLLRIVIYVQYLHPSEMTNQLKKAIHQAFKQINLEIATD